MSLNVRVGRVGIDTGPSVIYCGRPGRGVPGPYGNPFAVGRDGSRDEVIEKHARWFMAIKQANLRASLLVDAQAASTHGQVVLACFCTPQRCHCDIMAEWLRSFDS